MPLKKIIINPHAYELNIMKNQHQNIVKFIKHHHHSKLDITIIIIKSPSKYNFK